MRLNTKAVNATAINNTAACTLPDPGPDQRWRIKHVNAGVSGGSAPWALTCGGDTLLTGVVYPGSGVQIPWGDVQATQAHQPVVLTVLAAGSGFTSYVNLVGALEH